MPDIGQVNLTNIPGAIIADNSISNAKIQSIDIKNNVPMRLSRVGAYSPSNANNFAQDSWGVLKGLVGVGIQVGSNYNTAGRYHTWSTYGTAINDAAGVLKIDSGITWRAFDPLIRFAFLYDPTNIATQRTFKGLTSNRLLTVSSDTAPLLNSESGFIFGHGAGDSQFYIFHNDGTGACVKDPTGVNIPAINTNYIVEIKGDRSNSLFTWTLYSVIAYGIKGTVLGTGIINTRIPAQLTLLYLQDLVSRSISTITYNYIHYIEVFNS